MMRTMMRTSRFSGLLLAAVLLACDAGSKAPKVSLAQAKAASVHNAAGVQGVEPALSAQAKAALDSANVLFRNKAYTAALAQYRAASSLAPRHAAPYFGINMVAQATNDKALSDSALAQIRANTPVPQTVPLQMNDSAFKKIHANAKKGPVS